MWYLTAIVTIGIIGVLVVDIYFLACMERIANSTAATQKDLDDAVAALPQALEDYLNNAIKPIIAAIESKSEGTSVDFQSEIDQLNALAGTVSAQVASDVSPAS